MPADRSREALTKRRIVTINVFTLLGGLGVLLIVVSYLWLITGKVSSDGIHYPAVNALGAVLIIVSLIDSFNLPALLIEAFWFVISILGIWNNLRGRRRRSRRRIERSI